MRPKSQSRSKRNRARQSTRGITRQILALIPADGESYSDFEQGYLESLNAVGPIEIALASVIARDHWRISAISARIQRTVVSNLRLLEQAQATRPS